MIAKSSSHHAWQWEKIGRAESGLAGLQIIELPNEDYKITVFLYFKYKMS